MAIIIFALISIVIMIYLAVSLQASDLRVVTHYSAFGVTHFYRDQWVYFIGYIVAALIGLVGFIALSMKLLMQERAPLAVALIWLGVGIQVFLLMTFVRFGEFL